MRGQGKDGARRHQKGFGRDLLVTEQACHPCDERRKRRGEALCGDLPVAGRKLHKPLDYGGVIGLAGKVPVPRKACRVPFFKRLLHVPLRGLHLACAACGRVGLCDRVAALAYDAGLAAIAGRAVGKERRRLAVRMKVAKVDASSRQRYTLTPWLCAESSTLWRLATSSPSMPTTFLSPSKRMPSSVSKSHIRETSTPWTSWKYWSTRAGCWLTSGAGGLESGRVKSKVIGSVWGQCQSSAPENWFCAPGHLHRHLRTSPG